PNEILISMKNQIVSDFNQCNIGLLKEGHLQKAFNTRKTAFVLGRFAKYKLLVKKHVDCVSITQFEGLHVVKVAFPKNQFGTFTGCSWTVPFDSPVEQARLRYKVFIPKDFDFVKGGKLPGLAGGSANTGGHIP